MFGIRFVHTDHLRLASPVTGLAAAPEWLRRQARDATRQAVINVCDIARNWGADFLLIAGRLSESADDLPNVIAWLAAPLADLRRRGTAVAIATAGDTAELPGLADICDVLIRSGERLDVDRTLGKFCLNAVPARRVCNSDLSVCFMSQASNGIQANCRYLVEPAVRQETKMADQGHTVYSAGSPQGLQPGEEGSFGCLLIAAEQGNVETTFETTDILRFATAAIDDRPIRCSNDVINAVMDASRELARRELGTWIVDWRIEQRIQCYSEIADFIPEDLLRRVREALQSGHVGIWPRRIDVEPQEIRLVQDRVPSSLRELASVLVVQATAPGHQNQSVLSALARGARLLRVA